MNVPILSCRIAAAAALALALSSAAAEPRVWVEFEHGKRLYREAEFGKALNAFRNAASERRRLFDAAAADLAAALDSPHARRAGGSVLALIDGFARDDFLASELREIEAKAGASIRRRIDLLRQGRLTGRFRGFLDALYLTLDYRTFDDIGDSLDVLRQAVAVLAMYPEAEFWIGRVFQAEGELRLAEIQYARAWDMREAFEIPDDRFTPLYALADIHRIRGDFLRMEEQYRTILAHSPTASDPKNEMLRTAMHNSLTRDGFDKFMTLYRLEEDFSVKAFDALGTFWYESGRQARAVLYLGLASNRILTKVIEALRAEDPSYAYQRLGELLARIAARVELREYARTAELHRLLFTLADALFAIGARTPARDLWRALSADPEAGAWGRRAASQLRSPVVKVPALP